MNAPQFLVAHGEKIILSTTVLICALGLYSTATDRSIRPIIASTDEIRRANQTIEDVFNKGTPPTMAPVPDYLGGLKKRINEPVAVDKYDSWLTQPFDRGPGGTNEHFFYLYEAQAPTLQVSDLTGSAEIIVSLPTSDRPQSGRVVDGDLHKWQLPNGSELTAQLVGVLIESRQAQQTRNEWLPVSGKGMDKGFVPLSSFASERKATITTDQLEAWVKLELRARLVIKTTGPDVDQPIPGDMKYGVLVATGKMPDPDWKRINEGLNKRTPEVVSKFGRPIPTPSGVETKPNESCFAGQADDPVALTITSDVRFALEKVQKDPNGKDQATFLITKQVKGPGIEKAWLEKVESLRVGKGEPITKSITAPTLFTNGNKIRIELNTPFKLAEVQTGVNRVLYYEIKEKPRPNGKGQKDLESSSKETKVDLVIVENSRTGQTTPLIRLMTIKAPKEGAITLPQFPYGDLDERKSFTSDPDTFQQSILVPPPPKRHEPNTGPLVKLQKLHPEQSDVYSTDTAYFELGDYDEEKGTGRLVWWDPLNKKTHIHPEASAAGVVVPPGGKAAVPGGMPPGMSIPGMPPGMGIPGMPPGMGIPGMPPGMNIPGMKPGTKPPGSK